MAPPEMVHPSARSPYIFKTPKAHVAETPTRHAIDYVWASLRIGLGFIFAWAFVDKLFGLGFATTRENAWINGGSPTEGFLTHGTKGPFAGFYQGIAGHPVTDALFMLGLAAIGVALLLGVGVRVAAWSGALLLMMMYTAALLPENNPVIDDHVIYAMTLVGLSMAHAGRTLGLGSWWSRQPLVQRYPVLE